jgi:5'-3' exonuclease
MNIFYDMDSILYVAATKGDEGYKYIDDSIGKMRYVLHTLFLDERETSENMYGGSIGNYRKDLDPSYKAHRPPSPEALKDMIAYCEEEYGMIRPIGHEVDDEIAIAVRKMPVYSCIIVSIDKDYNQVPSCFVFDYQKNQLTYISPVMAQYSFWCQMVEGDRADNVSGIPGKGAAFSKKLLKHVREPYHFLYRVYRQYLKNGLTRADFERNVKLLRLGGGY